MLRLAFDFIITWRETRTRPNAYKVQARGNAPRIASPKKDTKATPHLRMWQHGTMEYTNECQRKQLYAEVCSRRNMMQRTSITNPWL